MFRSTWILRIPAQGRTGHLVQIVKSWHRNSSLTPTELLQAHLNLSLTTKVPRNQVLVKPIALDLTCLYEEKISADPGLDNRNGQLWMNRRKLQLSIHILTKVIVDIVRRLPNPTPFSKFHPISKQTKLLPSTKPNGSQKGKYRTK